jgi:hypothetical protein
MEMDWSFMAGPREQAARAARRAGAGLRCGAGGRRRAHRGGAGLVWGARGKRARGKIGGGARAAARDGAPPRALDCAAQRARSALRACLLQRGSTRGGNPITPAGSSGGAAGGGGGAAAPAAAHAAGAAATPAALSITALAPADLPAHLAGAADVLHVKGFGSRVAAAPPAGFVARLAAADVIVFDGDDLANDSFTAAVRAAALARGARARLLAYVVDEPAERARVRASWAALAAPAGAALSVVPIARALLSEPRRVSVRAAAAAAAAAGASAGAAAPPEAPLPDVAGADATYVALGVAGLEMTIGAARGRVSVACWGGGAIVAQEFAVGAAARLGVRWTYWHAARAARGGGVEEGGLGAVRHAALSRVEK